MKKKPAFGKDQRSAIRSLVSLKHFSKIHMLFFALVSGLIASYIVFSTYASTVAIDTVETETMVLPTGATIISDSAASATKAVWLTSNGTLISSVSLDSAVTSLTVRAKGVQCKGAPQMVVKVDGSTVQTFSVSSTSWSEAYTANVSLTANTHSLSIAFTNDNRKGCSRDLFVDKLTFYGTVTPPPPGDTTAPSAPTNLKGANNTLTSIDLVWDAANDDTGVTNYKVYRDGTLVNTLGNVTSYTDSGLTQNTIYSYGVVAYDAAGNASVASNTAPVITKEGPMAPPPPYTLDSTFDYPSKSDPENYRQKVDFNVVCLAGTSSPIARVAADDPIVYPGQPGAAHMHVFVGNTSVDAYSTQQSLESGGTECRLDRDTATYWMPQLYTNGMAVLPYHARAYYRAGSLNPVSNIPRGLKIIAGNAHATTPQDRAIAGWQCRTISPDTQSVPKQSTIPTCPSADVLEGSVVFPNCWDGVNLDSLDHKSHMSYSKEDGNPDNCDSAHPIQVPQLTLAYRYPAGQTNSGSYLSSMNSGLTLHGDFWNAWHQPTLDALVDRCINAGVHCGDVSPTHFPGPMP